MTKRVLERMCLVVGGPHVLEGLFAEGRTAPTVVLASTHPSAGGAMDASVLTECVWTLVREDHATLRFNWSGVGASQGPRSDDPRDHISDLWAALEHMRATRGGLPALVAHGFGCAVLGEALADEQPPFPEGAPGGKELPCRRPIAAISPPVKLLSDRAARAIATADVRVVTGEHDHHASAAQLAARGIDADVIPGADAVFLRGLPQLALWVEQVVSASRVDRDE